MIEIILLLLIPLAAWAGWWFARNFSRRGERKRNKVFSSRYFQGLNYLLDEQPDKAIQVFLEMAEVNEDTVETHLALGSLFRRRGEVDRAIRLHQNIISKHSLDDTQRTKALLELGEDYMSAGLLDRAERLFSELTEREAHAPSALRHLLDIYQQEKDWEKALEKARQLEELTGTRMGLYMSQFCCELAEIELGKDRVEAARKFLRQARRHDPQSIRARVIAAHIAEQKGDFPEAMDIYEDIAELDGDYLPDMLSKYLYSADKCSQQDRAVDKLKLWSERHEGISVVLELTRKIHQQQGISKAARYLAEELSRNPSVRGLDTLIELKLEGGPEIESGEEILRAVAQRLLARQSTHRCTHCGFGGHTHHWLCPSCKHWGTTRVIRGVLGE